METRDRDSRKGSEEGVEKSNVVRLPRDWLGPREELVPFGPSAYRERPEVDQHLSELGSPSLTQDDFWGGDLDAVPRPVIGPQPAEGFSVRRGAGGDFDVDAAGVAARAVATGPRGQASRWSRLLRSRISWAIRPSLPLIHLGWATAAFLRRAGLVGLGVALAVGAAVLGLNLVASSHPVRETAQIAAVSRTTDGLVAPPLHVGALRPVQAPKRSPVASQARSHRVPRSASRSSSGRPSHQSAPVTYVARVTPTQSYQPAPAHVGGTPAASETPGTSTAGQSATIARQTSSSAAGPTGLGSQVGTDCNPKCR